MKKLLCFILTVIILFACKQNVENGGIKKPAPKDTSLKQLVIEQVGAEAISFASPIKKELTINLSKKIINGGAFTRTATPKEDGVNVFFDDVKKSSKIKRYDTFQEKIKIELKAENSTPTTYVLTIEEPNDATLKELIIKQTGATVQSFQATVADTLNVTLTKRVNATDKLRIEATPTDSNANVYFNSVLEDSKTKEYTSSVSKITIKVEKGSATKEYTLNITEPPAPPQTYDSSLKKLVIKQGSETLKNEEDNVALSHKVQLLKEVSSTEPLIIEAKAKETEAKIYFTTKKVPSNADWEEVSQKKYESYEAFVQIKCTHEDSSKIYKISMKKPIPTDYNVVCNVLDSVGGSNVEGVTVKAFLTGKTVEKGVSITNAEGNAYFKLDADASYDFVLSKKGRAASRVENAYIKQNEVKMLPIVMREWFIGSKAIAPEMNKVLFSKKVGNNWEHKQMKDVFEFDCAALSSTSNSMFQIETVSRSGEIIPEKVANWNNNNGIGMNIGSPFRHDGAFDMNPAHRLEVKDGKKIVYDNDGVRQAFAFTTHSLLALDGEITLYFISYDVAGNRCERQERIKIKNGKLKNEIDSTHRFSIFQASSKRYYRSLATFDLGNAELFGMPSEEGVPTSLDVEFIFRLNQRIRIGRVDVMRRDYQEGNIQDGWECVCVRQYSYRDGYSGSLYGYFLIHDDSGTLEEGKTYQYKLVVYGNDGKITSNVATLKIMEAFNLKLLSPASRASIKKDEIKNQDFSFRISNTELWSREKADYFSFGILVLEDEYYEYENYGLPGYSGLCFAAKLKYDFTKTGNDAFLIAGAASDNDKYNYKVFNKYYGASSLSLDDVFKYEDGTITLKNKFFAKASFNTFGKKALEDAVYSGIHYWDVPNMSQKLLIERYDRGVAFVKEYPYLDAKTGAEVHGFGKSRSSSFSNLNRSGGAVNGRAIFTVKD